MSWVGIAILSATVLGVVNIIDSHLLSKRMPSLQAYLVPAGIIFAIYSGVLSFIFPLPEGTSIWILLVALASGILRTGAVTIMFYNLTKEEVSRVIPVIYTYPIFVAIMATPLLGESLDYLQWLAIIMVVAGAVMVSVRQSPSGSTTWHIKPFLLLFSASMFFALADLASKYALAYISVWNVFWLGVFCMSGVFMLVSIRPHIFGQLSNMKQRNTALGLVVLSGTLSVVGMILILWAIAKGPVSLVSTIIGSRPAFVVIYALILSHVSPMFLEWHPGKGKLALRLTATAMIVSGIAIIYLT